MSLKFKPVARSDWFLFHTPAVDTSLGTHAFLCSSTKLVTAPTVRKNGKMKIQRTVNFTALLLSIANDVCSKHTDIKFKVIFTNVKLINWHKFYLFRWHYLWREIPRQQTSYCTSLGEEGKWCQLLGFLSCFWRLQEPVCFQSCMRHKSEKNDNVCPCLLFYFLMSKQQRSYFLHAN
jgi:hypothetical protein